jgi:hypothetical protein
MEGVPNTAAVSDILCLHILSSDTIDSPTSALRLHQRYLAAKQGVGEKCP